VAKLFGINCDIIIALHWKIPDFSSRPPRVDDEILLS
jgi:hypothetical protein